VRGEPQRRPTSRAIVAASPRAGTVTVRSAAKELQSVYEAVLDRPFDQTNFGRRVTELGMVEPIDQGSKEAEEARARAAGRPAASRWSSGSRRGS
jgi:hypothetical protein